MRYVIFSDVHANIEALAAVLAHAARKRKDAWVFLGDAVGYGAAPNQVVERLRRPRSEERRGGAGEPRPRGFGSGSRHRGLQRPRQAGGALDVHRFAPRQPPLAGRCARRAGVAGA
uniref:Metallophosphatase family protein n=1 Tax=Thermoanaerobaculum aquaticum TaxID=1312852 RepID=A0A7V2EF13_9BACT